MQQEEGKCRKSPDLGERRAEKEDIFDTALDFMKSQKEKFHFHHKALFKKGLKSSTNSSFILSVLRTLTGG